MAFDLMIGGGLLGFTVLGPCFAIGLRCQDGDIGSSIRIMDWCSRGQSRSVTGLSDDLPLEWSNKRSAGSAISEEEGQGRWLIR